MGTITIPGSGGNTIKSIQRGIITAPNGTPGSGTATITSVDVSKSVVNLCGVAGNASWGAHEGVVSLTNSTTVTGSQYGSNSTRYISFEVIEFN